MNVPDPALAVIVAVGMTAVGMLVERLPELATSPAARTIRDRCERRRARRTLRRLERVLAAERTR
jgi:hypothetical protein